ncbi:MAG: hypothetical protein JXB49_06515 [Bacteroidales bacterium]|nr:hypothetical protein [Bacteroidales bacterium]
MSSSSTERMKVILTLKEYEDGKPYFMLEPSGEILSIMNDNSFFHLDLAKNVTFKEAQEILYYLDNRIAGLGITLF